ncbi:dihydrodipicolinate synthase family protein [Helcococcus sueciensis]|uniref:dihydrodipicolinate synthase family protein n=1 Tax=Helcococcus sueciensis TaxID=241555 RepID=UPI000402F844|nr:dihydrodipicolinate synthase family protein [Helcococcus sueciensis]
MGHFITGLVDEILTPFNEDGSINYEMTKEMINWHMSKGVKNFFVNGLGAESQSLTTEEKIELLKVIYGETQGKAKLMVCSFENSVEENKKLLDLYEETGMADCYCITAPPFFKHTQKALYDYTSELINHVDKPVYIYNCVQMGTLYEPDTLKKLVDNHPNLRGFKDASVDILNFIQCTLRIDKDNFDFLGGCDGLDGVMMLCGAVGAVSFMAVPYPKEMLDIVNYGLVGDYENCMKAQHKVLRIRNIVKKSPFNAAYIYAMKYGGGPTGMRSRMPKDQDYVSPEVKEELDNLMKELGYEVN